MSRRQAPLWPLMALTVAIAAMAFILSFDALRTLAVACGVQESLSWMFPLIIDAPVLAFTWATWVFKTRGLGQAYPWAMLIVFSMVSLVGNALHAHPVETNGLLLPDWGAALLMTMPPVALLATSHMIVRAASRSFDMETAPGPDPMPVEEPTEEPEAVPDPEPVEEPTEPEPTEPRPAGWRPDFAAPAPMPVEEPEPEPEPEPAAEPEPAEEPAAPEPEPASGSDLLGEQWSRAFAGDGRERLMDLIETKA